MACWPDGIMLLGQFSVIFEYRPGAQHASPATTSQLVVPLSERRDFIRRYNDSIFAGYLGVSRTVYQLLDRVYWPGLHEEV